MKVLKKDKLVAFIREHPDAEQSVRTWIDVANAATFEEEIIKVFRYVKLSNGNLTFRFATKPYFISVRLKYPALFVERVFKTSARKSENPTPLVYQKRRKTWI